MSYTYGQEERPYALYVHGMGSGAKSGTKTSLAHYLGGYEWLTPELPLDPVEALSVLDDYAHVFAPALVAGTSLGGLYVLYVDAPEAVKVAVNPTYNIDTILRRVGYGKHAYLCEREDGATEYVIDEPLVKLYAQFRDSHTPVDVSRKLALFSSDDEMVGREPSKQNARMYEKLGYEIVWSEKFGHRMNQAAAKLLSSLLG